MGRRFLSPAWAATAPTFGCVVTGMGSYGTDFRLRALVTAIGLGANLPQDAIYPVGEADSDGKPFDGANNHAMHFEVGQLPPVNGFWSLTMSGGQLFLRATSWTATR